MTDTEQFAPSIGDGLPRRAVGALEFEGVTKRYGRHTVVDDLSFVVEPGRVTGFLGPNGSGKSTTMKILLGLADSDAGRATIGGRQYRNLTDPAREVGVILEHNAFHPGRSGRNHLRIVADTAGIDQARVNEMLDEVGLGDAAADRRVGAYSLGMKQRLSLASALLGDPPILVLDEPANGLDPQGIRTLRDLLRARAERGSTVLVSSHLLAEIEHLADDVVVIDKGRLITTGSIADLRQGAALVRTPAAGDLEAALRAQGAAVESQGVGALVVRGLDLAEIGRLAHDRGVMLHELSPYAGSLEELFLDWTTTTAHGSDGGPAAEVMST